MPIARFVPEIRPLRGSPPKIAKLTPGAMAPGSLRESNITHTAGADPPGCPRDVGLPYLSREAFLPC